MIEEYDKGSAKTVFPEIWDLTNYDHQKGCSFFKEELESLPVEYREYFSSEYDFSNENLCDCWCATVITEKGEIAVFGDGELSNSTPLYIIELPPEDMSEEGLKNYINFNMVVFCMKMILIRNTIIIFL